MIPFLITIDVEGDNLWAKPSPIETRNAWFLPRFQALCERHRLKPTYLCDYEMAIDPVFIDFGREALKRGTAEIGMHLHAWNSPPLSPLTDDDNACSPYLIEFAQIDQQRKLAFLTYLLEDTFATKMRSHRAGRWAFDAIYAANLRELGYGVDCSVTPHVNWRRVKGNPMGAGGTDYSRFPPGHYWLGEHDISVPGDTSLLEVPMTIIDPLPAALVALAESNSERPRLLERALRRVWPVQWLRPNGSNLAPMCAILDHAAERRWPYVEFMLHSSELMPGGSPCFPTADSIEKLYDALTALFAKTLTGFVGKTLWEFREDVPSAERAAGPRREMAQCA